MIKFITDKDPILNINIKEVLLSESDAFNSAEQGIINAFKDTSTPCITKIISEVKKSHKMAYLKQRIGKCK